MNFAASDNTRLADQHTNLFAVIKISVSNARMFLHLRTIPLVKHFLVFFLPAMMELQDEQIKDDLYISLKYGDVTHKTTAGGRLDDIDPDTLELIDEPSKYMMSGFQVALHL